jgi:hypothetical protein
MKSHLHTLACLLFASSLLALLGLLGFVALKDAVHTGFEPRWLASPFLGAVLLASLLQYARASRVTRAALITALAGLVLPFYLHANQHLMSYGEWIHAGMPDKRSALLSFAIFLLIYAVALALTWIRVPRTS